ncbi:MAG: isocitrate lyase/phosphoenolpyruvate mutase family protein, partial [Acidimicrobiia bacterium]
DELLAHVEELVGAIGVPLNVDAERCFADDPSGVAVTVQLLADAGASGISIEDWNPATGTIDPADVAAERVAAAVEVADANGIVLTARAENHIRGVDDLDDTINRLVAYRDVGAHCLYAPGPTSVSAIERIVNEVDVPINVLLLPGGPPIDVLESIGVRRVSTGGALARTAYASIEAATADLR